jgi:hypothetical protein
MIAGLICGLSLLTLLQFFVSYCRSLIAASQGHELSEQAQEICGFTARAAASDHFARLLQLLSLCPDSGEDGIEIRAVTLYFRLLGLARVLLSWAIPSATTWIDAEQGGCAYAAAVVLDRRIAYSRMMMAQQTSH